MPEIQFVTTSDGVRIACAECGGGGPTLLWTPSWVSNIEVDWTSPEITELYQRLAANHRFVHFDGRGTGLSDRDVEDLSTAARARDIEAVVEGLGLESFDLFSWSFWGPAAITYAAEHPQRIGRLALYGTFARFPTGRSDLGRALLALIRAEWSVGSRTITEFVYPNTDHEREQVFVNYFRESATGQVAAAILEDGFAQVDVRPYLSRLSMPTAVLHRRGDPAVGYESGRELASLIRGARFIPLAGDIHVPWHGDVDGFLQALEGFLGMEPAPAVTMPSEHPAAETAPVAVLFTDVKSSTTLTGRLGDTAAQELLRVHNTIVREALRTHGGSEIKHTGDGIMASFSSATRAVQSAIAIQRALNQHNEQYPERPIRVRIGINAGEPVAEEDDLFGTAVQLASRICDCAEPGEILVSNVVRELAAGKGFLFASRGDVVLRGFEDPVRLYEVRWAE